MAGKKLTSKRTPKKDISAEQQEKALANMNNGKKEKGKFYGRVTVDFPHEIYDQMKERLKEEDRTMKGYFLQLVKKDLKNNG